MLAGSGVPARNMTCSASGGGSGLEKGVMEDDIPQVVPLSARSPASESRIARRSVLSLGPATRADTLGEALKMTFPLWI